MQIICSFRSEASSKAFNKFANRSCDNGCLHQPTLLLIKMIFNKTHYVLQFNNFAEFFCLLRLWGLWLCRLNRAVNSGVEYSDTLLTFKLLGKLVAFMSYLIQNFHFKFYRYPYESKRNQKSVQFCLFYVPFFDEVDREAKILKYYCSNIGSGSSISSESGSVSGCRVLMTKNKN